MTKSPVLNFSHVQPRAGSPEVPINEWMDAMEYAENRRVEWDVGTKSLLTQDDLASGKIHVFTGGLSGQVELFVAGLNEDDEPLERFFVIENQTTENIIVSISGQSGLSVVVPASYAEALHTDGVNVRIITFNTTILSTEGGGGGGASGAVVLIEEVVTAGSQADVTFSAISSGYRDLEIRLRGRGDTAATETIVLLQFNGDTGNNYDYQQLFGNNGSESTAHAQGTSSIRTVQIPGATATASFCGATNIHVHNYRGTSFFKEVSSGGGYSYTQQRTVVSSGQWRSLSVIASVKVFLSAGNFADDTVVSLYGHM